MLRKILPILFVAVQVTSSLAQNQVISKLKQPPPNKLGIADLWSLELNNTTRKDIKGYLTGLLSEDKDGSIVEGQSKPFIIKAGRNSYTYKDFSDADIRYSNNKYKEIFLRTGSAPEGDYTICVTVYNEVGDVIGIENCIFHSVRQLGNISLLTPADGDEISSDQAVVFSWTPLPDAKEYSIKIVELIGNQPPESAIQQNHPFFTKENIKTTQFQYPTTERKFQSNKSYAWIIWNNEVVSDIGLFKVKPTDVVSSNELRTNYRFTLLYPDGEIAEKNINNFQSELEEFAQIIIADEGLKAPKKVTIPKQTQGATFGERVNAGLVNFFAQGENAEFGEEILVLTGIPTGKIVQCPPPGCGCTDEGGVSCNCKLWPGNDNICLCYLCPIKGPGIDPIEFLPPPNNNNGIKTKDIVIILRNNSTDIDESFNDIIKFGLNKVAELRRNKIDALVIKQSYTLKKFTKIYFEYEEGKFVNLKLDDFPDEWQTKLSGIICMCDKEKGIGILCEKNNCDECCRRVLIPPATSAAFDDLSGDDKIKVCKAIAERGLNLKNCDSGRVSSVLANLIEQANETFRRSIASIFRKVAAQNELKNIKDNFVFVSPQTLFTSPVFSFEGVENLTEQELASGKDVMLTFFNVPSGSEIVSGLFIVKAYKDIASNLWKAQLRTLNGNVVLESGAEFGSGNSKRDLNGRGTFYSEAGFKVRFGYHTKGYSFYTNLRLKNGIVDQTRSNEDEQAILGAIGVYRNQIESALRKSTSIPIDKQILLASRDDAFFAFSIFEKINKNDDGSYDVFYTYCNAPSINPDFYKISIKQSGSNWKAYLINSRNETVKDLSVKVKDRVPEDIGLAGGIVNDELRMQLVNNRVINNIGLVEITIKF